MGQIEHYRELVGLDLVPCIMTSLREGLIASGSEPAWRNQYGYPGRPRDLPVKKRSYIPDRGGIVWLQFTP